MEKIIIKQDVYNEHGVLLIAKGAEIEMTEDKKILLKKMGKLDEILNFAENPNTPSNIETATKIFLEKRVKEVIVPNTTIDLEMIRKSTDVINFIVFECKKKDWHRYIMLLYSYVNWLYEHSINTAIISYLVGNALGYDEKELFDLCLGAIFHDIGLTLLPKNIIEKSTELTNVEYLIIKNHCELGYSLLSGFDVSETTKKIILQHHERLDGSGYPYGLTKEDLLEQSFIVMVAEYFDTATAKRNFKSAEKPGNVLKRMDLAKNLLPNYIVQIIKSMLKEELYEN